MTTIPRTVNINHAQGKLGMDNPVTSAIDDRISTDTWEPRYQQIISEAGYNTGRHTIKATPIDTWEKATNLDRVRASMYLDGLYFYYATKSNPRFVDLSRFKFWTKIRQPIHYYLMSEQKYVPNYDKDVALKVSSGFNRLINLLQEENFVLRTKNVRNAAPETSGNSRLYTTMAPEMIVDLIEDVYNLEPAPTHVIIASRDQLLIPAIHKLRQMNITVTLALAQHQSLSNHYMYQFNYIVDLIDLLDSGKVIIDRRPGTQHNYNTER